MDSIDKDVIREVFRDLRSIQDLLKDYDREMYREFVKQNQYINDLDDYNLKKSLRDGDDESIDTLELRRNLIKKWKEKLS